MTESTTNKPVFTFRLGTLSATIWQNRTKKGSYYRTEMVRNYRDTEGVWQTSSSFGHEELLNVAKLAERAEDYIARLTQS
ncbi:MAG: hypothetical protein AAF702_37630 [Chloroflexota bacterium]